MIILIMLMIEKKFLKIFIFASKAIDIYYIHYIYIFIIFSMNIIYYYK